VGHRVPHGCHSELAGSPRVDCLPAQRRDRRGATRVGSEGPRSFAFASREGLRLKRHGINLREATTQTTQRRVTRRRDLHGENRRGPVEEYEKACPSRQPVCDCALGNRNRNQMKASRIGAAIARCSHRPTPFGGHQWCATVVPRLSRCSLRCARAGFCQTPKSGRF
jgi:hypothetical protein